MPQDFVEPDQGPNCLQRLSADNIGRQRDKTKGIIAQLICALLFESS